MATSLTNIYRDYVSNTITCDYTAIRLNDVFFKDLFEYLQLFHEETKYGAILINSTNKLEEFINKYEPDFTDNNRKSKIKKVKRLLTFKRKKQKQKLKIYKEFLEKKELEKRVERLEKIILKYEI